MGEAKYVAYYRVSTKRQGQSGLGLEAQRATVSHYLSSVPTHLVAEFTEIESGKRSDRPELAQALATCRRHGATLIVAKLDRLARNVEFTARLMNSGVEFVCCDNPHANRLTIHILAAMAEYEREQISQRTKAGLAAAKARGLNLGTKSNLTNAARSRGVIAAAETRAMIADEKAKDLEVILKEIRRDGAKTDYAVAVALNERDEPTLSGRGRWYPATVTRLVERLNRMNGMPP
ncbi:MAG: recombinase family protein [Alphaproteobacteria bacterium]|nr:recombinase family protein [Alphaproteobacteria bacterium]